MAMKRFKYKMKGGLCIWYEVKLIDIHTSEFNWFLCDVEEEKEGIQLMEWQRVNLYFNVYIFVFIE